MNGSPELKRVAVVGLCLVSGLAGLCAIGVLTFSFLKPSEDIARLYQIARSLFRLGLGSIFVSLAVSIFLEYVFTSDRRFHDVLRSEYARRKPMLKVALALAAVMMAATLIQGFTLVRPSEGRWVSLSRAGSHEITESTAREYLWRLVTFSSLLLTVSSFSLFFQSTSVLHALGIDSVHRGRG